MTPPSSSTARFGLAAPHSLQYLAEIVRTQKPSKFTSRLGYCCVNLSLAEKLRTMTVSWAEANPGTWLARWREVVEHNMLVLARVVEWNMAAGIMLFRISSDLVPFADHPTLGRPWNRARASSTGWWQRAIAPSRAAIASARDAGARFTMHPAQFVSLGSSRARTRRSSISNLEYHGRLMDDLGLPRSLECPINIHASNGSKPWEAIPWVRRSLGKLSASVISRLVFENEQSGHWTPSALRSAFPKVPVTLDYHHLLLNPDHNLSLEEIESMVASSWAPFRPVCHWSEGRSHRMDPAHSEFVERLPVTSFDLEIEAKGKDLAVLRLLGRIAPGPSAS